MALRHVGWLAIALAGCKSNGAKPAAGAGSAGSGSAVAVAVAVEPRIPSGPVPVKLPAADPSYARHVGTAKAFVTLAPDGAITCGPIAPGVAPYTGMAVAEGRSLADAVTAAVAAYQAPTLVPPAPPPPPPDLGAPSRNPGGYAPDPYGGGGGLGMVGTYGQPTTTVRATFDVIGPLDVMMLADADAHGHALVGALAQIADRRIGLGIDGTGTPDALVYRFGPSQVPAWATTAARVRLSVGGVMVRDRYGGEQAVLAGPGGGVDRTALAAAITAAIDPYAGGTVAQLTLSTDATVQTIVDVLAAVALAKLTEIELVDQVDSGYGSGTAVLGGAVGNPKVTIGTPDVSGRLDKAIVRRYLKRNIARLQYCYEKELLVQPNLTGELHAAFGIDENGRALSAHADGLAPDVDSCVASVLNMIEYPKPKHGDFVFVGVTLTFEPTGG